MASAHSAPKYPVFRTSIDKLFNNWQAIQIAVENGQGGSYGKDIMIWMRQAVEDFFYQNDELDGDEVADFIGTMMNQELDTIVDDHSLEDLGEALVQHFKLAVSGKQMELQDLFRKLDEEASKPKPKAACQNNDDSSDESDNEDEAMEVDDSSATAGPSPPAAGDSQSPGSHLHRTGKNFVTEPDDDGWVTVTKSKKNS